MEIWDIYDSEGKKTGKTAVRGHSLEKREYHLVVMAWLRNKDGKYLISRRTLKKDPKERWETAGGSAVAGEDSLTAVLREVKEEIGIELDRSEGKLLKRIKVEASGSWFGDIYLFNIDYDKVKVVCQAEEVSETRLVTKDEIVSLIQDDNFFNSQIHKELVSLL